ncbi:hypothetical protein MHN80_23645 [Gordonia McavH-238-E]|uniref:hypothetical protein n=1 Tax=Gordonia sp. McavH-238-E TaxID=2917736 RepID=UPI001EF4A8D2|nr:hypothetical protein [Gordonia sp. McavH-238-E]MCG7635312.1 hypothetical protein [Gordonia sp. McavH-238-E]
MTAPHARTEDEVLAAATAGHIMAGMPPTDGDVAAARRVLRGHTSVEEELAKLGDELSRSRSARARR